MAPRTRRRAKNRPPLDENRTSPTSDDKQPTTVGLGPYATPIKKVEKEIKDMAKKGIKESDTGLAAPSQWDLVSDKQMMQEEQPLQSLDASQSNIFSNQSELSDTSFGRLVRSEVIGLYNESVLPKPLSAKEADAVLKKWDQQTKKRMAQSDIKCWMSQIKQDACSLEIRFTGDDCEPDTGLKKCDFSLVTKGSSIFNVDTVAVLSLQSADVIYNSDKEIGVAVRRAQQIIRASGLERKFCVAGVTNGITVQWVLVQRYMQNKFSFLQSPEYSFRESLCAILTAKPKDLYYSKLDPVHVNGKQLVFNNLLGCGATSKVYACQYNGQKVAAKLYDNPSNSEYEAAVLEDLKNVSNIPTVVASDLGILIIKQAGQSLQYGPVLEQEYAKKLCDIVDTLEAAHNLGYVHRDVRMPNILKVKQEGETGMMLIDWGFAATSTTQFAFAGNYVTASDNILDQLKTQLQSSTMPPPGKRTRVATRSTSSTLSAPKPWYQDPSALLVKCEPTDDLISLVRSFYLYVKRCKAYKGSWDDCEGIKDFWASEFATNKTFFCAQQLAASCKYKELKWWLSIWADYFS